MVICTHPRHGISSAHLTSFVSRPRDGRNIGWWHLICALHEVYNLSYPLAILLSTAAVLWCGCWYRLPWTVDLHALSWHNHIEHNCSMTHADSIPGEKFAPSRPDAVLLARLLACAPGSRYFGLHDFVTARIRRAQEDRKPLDLIHKEIAHGEVALSLLVLGEHPAGSVSSADKSLAVPRRFVEQWFGEERLPDGWIKPARSVGLWRARCMSTSVAQAIFMRDWVARSA